MLWRKGSFGSRSAEGCRFAERMLRGCATCAQQGRPRLAFVSEAVRAAWAGEPAPPLVPAPERAGAARRFRPGARQTTRKRGAFLRPIGHPDLLPG